MAFEVNYTRTERLIHRLAFASRSVQLAAEDIESQVFARSFRNTTAARPIFLTSLPRAGTTMVLEVMHRLPGLATTTYRDMPFVMAPMLWSTFSKPFQRRGNLRERAHGDGVEISYDSPEGFEEVIWRTFWPENYLSDRLLCWQVQDTKAEATDFLHRHMKKIVALRRPDEPEARYISKNNANIARLALLARMFPDGTFLVILRNPLEHATSLHRQHMNFVQRQTADKFVGRYMSDIGHFEFGAMHRPIDFAKPESIHDSYGTDHPDYWLAYWISAFTAVEAACGDLDRQIVLANYERLCADGVSAFGEICECLGLDTGGALAGACAQVHPVRFRADPTAFDANLVSAAKALHARLLDRAL